MKQTVWKTAIGVALIILISAAYLLVRTNTAHRPHPKAPRIHTFPSSDRYWNEARETYYKSVPQLIAQHRSELERGVRHDILYHGSKSEKQIAITFDDGPHPKYTRKTLAILDRYDAKATFFLVGEMAERHPDLVKAEIAGGHSVGNHTYHHVNLTKIPVGSVATEIAACDEVLHGIIKRPVRLFRPPGGDYNDNVAQVCEVLKHTMVLWTDDPADYARPGAGTIEQRVLKRARNGGIILIHDGVQQTIDALPRILRALQDEGYKTVTIDEMMKERNREP